MTEGALQLGRRRAIAWPRIFSADHPLPWLLPTVSLLLVLGVFPFLYNVWLSFHEYNTALRGVAWVGWDNWERLLTEGRMWHALGVTLLYAGVCLSLQLVLGIAIALLLDSDLPSFGLLRALMTLPLVVPPAVTGLMFLLMEDAQFGVLSHALYALGVIHPSQPVLSTPSTALAGVVLADVWQWTPFMVLIVLAGLRAMPKEPFEAAAIDGAGPVQTFVRLTLPMLSRVLAVAVLIRGIDLFRVFDYVYIMTSGGPGTTTETVSYYTWQQTFAFIKWGYGATLSLFAMVLLIAVANLFVSIARVRW